MRGLRTAIVAGVLAAAAPAFAGTVNATLSTVSPSVTNLSVSFNGGGFENCYVGQLDWVNNTGTDPLVGSSFSTFCIDGTQNVYLGGTVTYTVGSLATSPQPVDVYPYGMGAERALRLTDFWNKYMSTTTGSVIVPAGYTANQANAAFQIGIWEIEYDSPTSTTGPINFTPDLYNGNFKLQTTASSDPSVVLAQSWLTADLSTAGSAYSLYALQSDTAQDQVFGVLNPPPVGGEVPVVPLPAALPMGAAMLSGMGLIARLRRRNR